MHGPWHPILHNAPRPRKVTGQKTTEDFSEISNDYSWYRPLDPVKKEIRILFLEPEPADSPKDVVVHVFNGSLLEPNIPRLYGCLSYFWGDAKVTKPIQVNYSEKSSRESNGLVTSQTTFNITTNLEAALRVLRSTLSRPVLWADAICIDQSDDKERSSQVALMAEIYSQAVQTIVWLGESDQTVKMVFEFADLLTKMERNANEVDPSTKAAGILCGRLRPLTKGQLRFSDEEVTSDDFYKMRWGIQALLARPFFRRVWVLQEVGLALTKDIVVHCGSSLIWWATFLNLTSFEWRAAAYQGHLPIDIDRDRRLGLPAHNPAMAPDAHHVLPEMWSYMRDHCSNTKRGNILDLIIRRQEFQAKNPRDQVYAMLGLARECQDRENLHSGFIPDYSLSIKEVYTRFTRAVIETLQNVIVLSAIDTFGSSPTREKRGMPSWVPEYDRHINLRQTFAFLGEGHYRTSGKTKTVIEQTDADTIAIQGVIFDRVGRDAALGPYKISVQTDNVSDPTNIAILSIEGVEGGIKQLWLATMSKATGTHVEGQDLIESFILTLIGSRREFFNRHLIQKVLDLPDLLADFAAYWLMLYGNFISLPSVSTLYSSHDHLRAIGVKGLPGRFGQRLFYPCNGRSFLITEGGLLALVSGRLTTGDEFAALQGGNVPYLVRGERASSSSTVSEWKGRIIGECYIHGRMMGSAVLEADTGAMLWKRLLFC
jgi:hypothetical protein